MPRAVSERPTDLCIDGPAGRRIVVEWFRHGKGLFGLDRRCERGAATHGRITAVGLGSHVESRRIVTVEQVDAAVDSIRVGWPLPVAALVAGTARSRCGRCEMDRTYEGQQRLLDRVGLSLSLSVEAKTFTLDLYACPACGSLELFLPGRMDHPLM